MPKKQQSHKVYGAKTHYWNNEIKLLLIAALCVYRALEFSTKANEVYKLILEAMGKARMSCIDKREYINTDIRDYTMGKAVTNKEEYCRKI
jgi:hypothetical protein